MAYKVNRKKKENSYHKGLQRRTYGILLLISYKHYGLVTEAVMAETRQAGDERNRTNPGKFGRNRTNRAKQAKLGETGLKQAFLGKHGAKRGKKRAKLGKNKEKKQAKTWTGVK